MGWSPSRSMSRTNMHLLEIAQHVKLTGKEEHIYDSSLEIPQLGRKVRAVLQSARLYPDTHDGQFTFVKDYVEVKAGAAECVLGYVRIVPKKKKSKPSIRDELQSIEELKRLGTGQTIMPPFYPSSQCTPERIIELLAAHTSYIMVGVPAHAPNGTLIVNIEERQPDPDLIAELEAARDAYEQRPSVFDQFFGKPTGPVINEERFARRLAEMEEE